MFFNERAATSEKILTTAFERKMCNCFLEFCPLKKYFEKPIKIKMMKRYSQKPMTFMYFWLNQCDENNHIEIIPVAVKDRSSF